MGNRLIVIHVLSRFKKINLLAPAFRLVCEALKGIGDNTASAFGFFKCAHDYAPSFQWRVVIGSSYRDGLWTRSLSNSPLITEVILRWSMALLRRACLHK